MSAVIISAIAIYILFHFKGVVLRYVESCKEDDSDLNQKL